jgi:hypothetical protein
LKDYINKYSGKLGERNGGINEFYGLVDVRISKNILFNASIRQQSVFIDLDLPFFNN